MEKIIKKTDNFKFGNEYIYVVSERENLDNKKYFLDYESALNLFKSDEIKYNFCRYKIEK